MPLDRLHDALDGLHAPRARRAWHVPGRIEVLGKHTDYAGGRSLLGATSRGLTVLAAPRRDRGVRVLDIVRGLEATFELSPDQPITQTSWARYPTTVARRLARDFRGLSVGAEIVFASDLPAAAGASSSSALVVAIYTALAEVNQLAERADFQRTIPHEAALATYLGCVENGYAYGELEADGGVGTAGGSEDHTAILLSRAGVLGQFSFCPVRAERTVPLPSELVFVVAASGIEAAKADGVRERFNRLSSSASHLAQLWRRRTGRTEATLGDVATVPEGLDRLAAMLERADDEPFPRAELRQRLEQFQLESEQAVPQAARALAAGNLREFARWVERSVETGARCLGNQLPETLALTEQALRLGAVAASPFGGGFGGSVWALLAARKAAGFVEAWLRCYLELFPRCASTATAFVTPAAEGAHRLVPPPRPEPAGESREEGSAPRVDSALARSTGT